MGVCSRKQADQMVKNGEVLVNDKMAYIGMKIRAEDEVRVKGQLVSKQPEPIFLLYNKPRGVVCTHDSDVANSLQNVLNLPDRVFAVGRLDKESEGLLLLTNRGEVVNRIMRAENKHEKHYHVEVDKPITQAFIQQMASGVDILNTRTLPCQVKKLGEQQFLIVLTQGLNRQIRRMCKALGYRVVALKRSQIMHCQLGDLPSGAYRQLTGHEVSDLYQQIEHSVESSSIRKT